MASLSLLTFLPGRPRWPLGTAWLLPKGLPTGFTGGLRRNEKPSFHPHFENAFKQYPESFELRRSLDDKVRQALSSDPAGSLGPVPRMAYLLGSAPALRGHRPPQGCPAPLLTLGQSAKRPPLAIFTGWSLPVSRVCRIQTRLRPARP